MDQEPANSRDDSTTPASFLSGTSIRQRAGLGVALTVAVVGLYWSSSSGSPDELVPLTNDIGLTKSESRELEQRLRAAGLAEIRRANGQILVPRSRLNEYSALLPSTQPTKDWAAEWERQNERLTPFSGSRALETNREIARAKLIAGMLRQLPDVESADVVWDEDERPGWRQSAETRATVYLNPKPGRVLTLELIRAVRLAVSGSKKNLDAENVVVMDLDRQVTYEGPLARSVAAVVIPRLRSLAELYRRELLDQISELSHADVAVHLDLPRLFQQLSLNDEADSSSSSFAGQLSTVAPTLMRVHVTVPLPGDVSGSTEESMRQSLQEKIVRTTGIGTEDPTGQLLIRFARDSVGEIPQTEDSHLGVFENVTWTGLLGRIGVFLLLASCFLWGCLTARRRRSKGPPQRASAPPVLSDLNGGGRDVDPVGLVSRFEDLSKLRPEEIQQLYSDSSPRCWAVALRGAPGQTGDRIAAVLAPDAAAALRLEVDRLGPVTIREIESAQQRVIESLDVPHASIV